MARSFTASSSQYLRRTGAVVSGVPATFACWFRPSNVAGGVDKTLISVDDNAVGVNGLLMSSVASTGRCVLQTLATDGGDTVTTGGTVTNGVWTHFGGVFASATSRTAYLNGVPSSVNTSLSTPSGMTLTQVGANFAGNGFADGDMGEAAIWRVALSASDMQRLAMGVSPLQVQRGYLVAYWPLKDGGTEYDRVAGFALTPGAGGQNPPLSASLPPMQRVIEQSRQRRKRAA